LPYTLKEFGWRDRKNHEKPVSSQAGILTMQLVSDTCYRCAKPLFLSNMFSEIKFISFYVFVTAVTMKSTTFSTVTPSSWVEIHRRLEERIASILRIEGQSKQGTNNGQVEGRAFFSPDYITWHTVHVEDGGDILPRNMTYFTELHGIITRI
jgi:hypothetical protein